MPNPTQSTKFSEDVEVKAPLRFFNHVKVKKADKLKEALEEESLKPQTSNVTGYFIKILKDRVEFVTDRNAKKLPIKRIKFSKVERIIPVDEILCIYMGCRQGKTATVTSLGFSEESVYSTLMNHLTQTRGLSIDPKGIGNQTLVSGTIASTELQDNLELDDTTLLSNEFANLSRRFSQKYTTSYVLWEDSETAEPVQKHRPADIQVSGKDISIDLKDGVEILKEVPEVKSDSQTNEITEEISAFQEVQHCQCCLHHSGINLELKNHDRKAYAPLSVDNRTCSNLPIHFPHNYKRYAPSQPSHRPKQAVTEDLSSVVDESTFTKYDHPEPIELHLPNKQRHRSQPPPSTRHVEKVSVPILSRPPQLPHKIKPSAQRSTRQTWTAKSSSSSGYTSDVIYEDGLELKVNSSTSGKYISNKKRTVTGRIEGSENLKNMEPQKYYYRKTNSSLPRYRQLKIQ
ncbi:unnamed protein product [Hymenolepis diminuta]|uniref:Uncharacterized protein n=1 Tax=Hymenolepis diminuta TaxID=6216 RepID=A0A564YXD8_HYMDI|nr:unnamed protein product [Hymenolepis diminuta]